MFKKKKSRKLSPSEDISLSKEKSERTPVISKKMKSPKKSKSRLVFWFVIIALMIFLSINIYHNLQNKNKVSSTPTAPISLKKTSEVPSAYNIQKHENNKEQITLTAIEKEDLTRHTPSTDLLEKSNNHVQILQQDTSKKDEIKNKDKSNETKISPLLSPIQQAEILEEKIELALSSDVMEPYTLKDALIFRDHFLSEQPCGNDFRKLILADNKSKSAQDVIKNTSYFCLTTNNVYQELYTLFLSAKQKALIHNYEVTYPRWKAKLYAFLTRIIQIRNLNPTGETISDNLDRAQNALENKNVEIATQEIAQLPSQMQPFFLEFLEKAQNYADASNALENLILSYAKGE